MKRTLLSLTVLLLAGCSSTRSISNSSYQQPPGFFSGLAQPPHHSSASFYHGELSEFDVLGVNRHAVASDTEIERTLDAAKRVRLKPGCSILLIQSGATFPDGPMVAELSKHFRVVPFSGTPPAGTPGANSGADRAALARSLRMAAASGGNDMILCYWGVLESANEKWATKTVTWLPVVNQIVPDEKERMRLRLKLALIDVRTGDWAMLSPPPQEASGLSFKHRRDVTDQKLVETLKERAYVAGARELIRDYSKAPAIN